MDFTDVTNPTATSVHITVNGHLFSKNPSFNFAISGAQGVLGASDGSPFGVLTLMFTIPDVGTLAGFTVGMIDGGEGIFGTPTGVLFNATGTVKLDPSDPPIPDPPDPVTPTAVPELSTWAMMLLGFAGLGFAAKRRRAIGFLAKA